MSTDGQLKPRQEWWHGGMSRELTSTLGDFLRPLLLSRVFVLLTSTACELHLDLRHFYIEQAFVQCDLKENVFIRLPQGCGRLSGKIVRLTRSLYGLKQASRQWHAHRTRCLLTAGFL